MPSGSVMPVRLMRSLVAASAAQKCASWAASGASGGSRCGASAARTWLSKPDLSRAFIAATIRPVGPQHKLESDCMSNAKIERWQELVARDPENPLHNFALAQAWLGAGDFAAGERAFARCLQLKPDWMVAAIKRGRCLIALERWDEAR